MPGREDARERRVPAEPDDDTRPVPAHDRDRAEHRGERAPERFEVLQREPALESPPGKQVDLEAGLGNDPPFDAALAADEAHGATAPLQLLRDRDRRIGVTAGPAAREQGEDRLAHDARVRVRERAGVVLRGGRLLRRGTRGNGCVPGDVRHDAHREHRDHERRAADREERQRDARHGQHTDDRAEVDRSLPDDPRGDTGGEEHAEGIGRTARDAEPDEPEPGEQPEHEQAADEPDLFADDREDEVGVRVREEEPLGAARTEADAVDAAAADRDQRPVELVAGVADVVARMQEREHARPPVAGAQREHGRGRHTEAGQRREVLRRARPPRSAARTRSTASTIVDARSGSFITSAAKIARSTSSGRQARGSVDPIGAPGEDLGAAQQQARSSRPRSAATGSARSRASAANRRRACRCAARGRRRAGPT